MLGRINWSPDKRALRQFGVTMLVGLGLIGAVVAWRGSLQVGGVLAAVGIVLALIGRFAPAAALPAYRVWMGIGYAIGSVVSRVIIAVIFYGMVTPVGLFFRIIKRDELGIRSVARKRESYWADHPDSRDPKQFEHLF